MKFFESKINKIFLQGLCAVVIFFSVSSFCLAEFGSPGGYIGDETPILKDGEICPEGWGPCDCNGKMIAENVKCEFPKTITVGDTPDIELDLQIPVSNLSGETIKHIDSMNEYFKLVYDWSIGAISIIAVVMIMIAGFQWITAGGNEKGIGEAKQRIKNAIFGLVLVGVAFLLLQLVNPAVLSSNILIPKIVRLLGLASGGGNSGNCTQMMGDAVSYSTGWLGDAKRDQWDEQLRAAAESNNIDCDYLKAIMLTESYSDPDLISPMGACGLMQVLPGTADMLGFGNRCLSGETLAQENLNAGAKYVAQLSQNSKIDGDFNLIAAGYNAGLGANDSSEDCPGLKQWQCEWDNAAHTEENTGFKETRNYVRKTQGYLNMIISEGASCNADKISYATVCTEGGNGISVVATGNSELSSSYNSTTLDSRWNLSSEMQAQLDAGDASPALISFLNCVKDQLKDTPAVGRITSIGDSRHNGELELCAGACAARCTHTCGSCHYGGKTNPICKGKSYAVDFGDEENHSKLAAAAKTCDKNSWAYLEGDHTHISIGKSNNCSCQ
ncbi:MAG: transglycosylase SLT domain-containing protein [Patescibacteria group bacterium]